MINLHYHVATLGDMLAHLVALGGDAAEAAAEIDALARDEPGLTRLRRSVDWSLGEFDSVRSKVDVPRETMVVYTTRRHVPYHLTRDGGVVPLDVAALQTSSLTGWLPVVAGDVGLETAAAVGDGALRQAGLVLGMWMSDNLASDIMARYAEVLRRDAAGWAAHVERRALGEITTAIRSADPAAPVCKRLDDDWVTHENLAARLAARAMIVEYARVDHTGPVYAASFEAWTNLKGS